MHNEPRGAILNADWLNQDWMRETTAYLAAESGEMTAEQIARRIHHALVIAEAEKYATEESQFIFGLRGATTEDIAEIWRRLTPFERSIVVIQNAD